MTKQRFNGVGFYVLAGGQARRFGRDKAVEPIDGKTLIEQVIARLSPVLGTATLVVDKPGRYARLNQRTITDASPGLGPIGGLLAALWDAEQRSMSWAFLASCDLVRPDPAWVALLNQNRQPRGGPVAYRGTHWEPLFAFYPVACRPAVEQQINTRRRSLQHLLDRCHATAVTLPDGLTGLPQANTPEALRDLLH